MGNCTEHKSILEAAPQLLAVRAGPALEPCGHNFFSRRMKVGQPRPRFLLLDWDPVSDDHILIGLLMGRNKKSLRTLAWTSEVLPGAPIY